MFQMEDDPQAADDQLIETIHLYVVREAEPKPSLVPVILSVLTLSLLIALGVLLPYQQPEIRTAIRVPAVLLPLTTFRTSVTIIPTGAKTYPATTAHGTLTITNGSVIAEHLPAGMIFTGSDGIEVVTTESVDVPAGNGTSYGTASVMAQAVVAGGKGNIAPFDIQLVYGTSLYIKNYRNFTGGQEAQTVTFITSQDRQISLSQARQSLIQQTLASLLQSPCKETVTGTDTLQVTWTCQFVRYDVPDLPGVRVLHAEVAGHVVLLEIVYVARPRILTTK
jgi:baseplate J-like protein